MHIRIGSWNIDQIYSIQDIIRFLLARIRLIILFTILGGLRLFQVDSAVRAFLAYHNVQSYTGISGNDKNVNNTNNSK